MDKLMATNIQRDLSEAKTVRQSLYAMALAIAAVCFFVLSRTAEADEPGVRVAIIPRFDNSAISLIRLFPQAIIKRR